MKVVPLEIEDRDLNGNVSNNSTRSSLNQVENVRVIMNNFKDDREKKKNMECRYVWLFGVKLLVVGIILYEIFSYFISVSLDILTQIITGILQSISLVISMIGVVIFSTVDPSRINFDSIVEEGNTLSVVFRVATCIIQVGDAFFWYGVCAIPAVCLMMYNLVYLVPYSCLKLKFSTRFILSIILDEFVAAASYGYNAYESRIDGSYDGRFIAGFVVNAGYPTGSTFYKPWVALSVLCFTEGCMLACFWIYQLYLTKFNSTKALSPTTVMYISFYTFLNRYGLVVVVRGAVCIYYQSHSTDGSFSVGQSYIFNVFLIVTGILFLIPPVGLVILGPKTVFNFTSRRFDRDLQHLKEDGKFIAELLDGVDVQLHQSYWVHYDKLGKGKRHYTDHRQNWYEGIVVQVNETEFTILMQPDCDDVSEVKMTFTVARKVKSTVNDIENPIETEFDMLTFASKNLRCIDWLNLSEELFTTSVRDEHADSLHSLSRPLKEKEVISFFISHAWNDDGKQKYQKLKLVAESFKSKNGQYPTFWFDKVCFDQKNISDGLKVLPINVMVCSKVLVLYGPSYSSRLWCIWELFVLFSFVDSTEAVKRLQLCPLLEDGDLSKNLSTFDVTQAHCYDPNEEIKLRKVISASGGEEGGVKEFNLKIQNLATYIRQPSGY